MSSIPATILYSEPRTVTVTAVMRLVPVSPQV